MAGIVKTDGSSATIAVTAVGDKATSDPGEASAGGIQVEDKTRERRTSRAGRDGESFDHGEDGSSKDGEVKDYLYRGMEEDEFVGSETGNEFV